MNTLPKITENVYHFKQKSGTKRVSKRHKYKPMDPAECARLAAETRTDPAKWGLNTEALRTPANSDVTVEDETRTKVKRAQRFDVFALMYFRPNSKLSTASYDAVRRLQRDMAILHRTEGASDAIRSTNPGGSWLTEGMSIARIEAGERVQWALDGRDDPGLPGMASAWAKRLLRDLCEHVVIRGSEANWHAAVTRHTGEKDRARRGDLVRQACDELAESYKAIDNEPRRAAA